MTYAAPTLMQRLYEGYETLMLKGLNLYFDVLGLPRQAQPTVEELDAYEQRLTQSRS